ncbi:hypothetical protein FOXYSP1_05925 [Fusarium oxysporum f. sp. phaseoli]
MIILRRYKRDTGQYGQYKDRVRARASATACAQRSIPKTNVSRTMVMGIDGQAHQHHNFALFSLFVYLVTGTPSSSTAGIHIGGALKLTYIVLLEKEMRNPQDGQKVRNTLLALL